MDQGMAHDLMHLVRQFHKAAGIPIETTRSMVDNWAPGTHEIYSQFIPDFIEHCCESQTALGSIDDQTISVYLTTGERATWSSAKLATARSAISGALYAGRGVSYRASPMLAVVSQSRRKGSPAPTPAYDTWSSRNTAASTKTRTAISPWTTTTTQIANCATPRSACNTA
jgi:hypothetical protein